MSVAIVIDDHPMTHIGCEPILREAGFKEILKASSSTEGLELTIERKPQLIILDLELPDIQGLTMIERLLKEVPSAKILIFSMHSDPMFAVCALGAGAHGYLTKNSPPDEFLTAIKVIDQGKTYLEHVLATELAVSKSRGDSNPLWGLKPRELQVLQLLGKGESHSEIAEKLGVGYKTVVTICGQLKAKLGAETLVDLVRVAIDSLPTSRPDS